MLQLAHTICAPFTDNLVRVTFAASQHRFDAYCGDCADGLSGVVLGQLLPYGIDRIALCGAIRGKQNLSLDERVT